MDCHPGKAWQQGGRWLFCQRARSSMTAGPGDSGRAGARPVRQTANYLVGARAEVTMPHYETIFLPSQNRMTLFYRMKKAPLGHWLVNPMQQGRWLCPIRIDFQCGLILHAGGHLTVQSNKKQGHRRYDIIPYTLVCTYLGSFTTLYPLVFPVILL